MMPTMAVAPAPTAETPTMVLRDIPEEPMRARA